MPLLIIDSKTNQVFYASPDSIEYFTQEQLIKMNDQDLNSVGRKVIKSLIKINNEDYYMVSIDEELPLINQEILLNDVFYHSPSAIVILDLNELVMMTNPSFTEMFGYTEEEVIGKSLDELVVQGKQNDEIKQNFKTVFNGGIVNQESKRKTKFNKMIDVHILGFPFIVDQKIVGVQVIYTNITEQVKNKEQLQLFKEIIQNNENGIVITDIDRKIQYANSSFTTITGFEFCEIENKTIDLLRSSLQSFVGVWNKLEQNGTYQGEVWSKNKAGIDQLLWLHLFAIKDEEGNIKNYVFNFKNLTENDQTSKKMLLMIQKDPLTSLYNRVYFIEHIELIKDSYLLFLDINQFKNINDTYGHHIGDEILVEFSKRLMKIFSNHLIARYGGDEFVVFIKDVSFEQLMKIIEAFKKLLDLPFCINDSTFNIKASIGISKYPCDGETIQDLILKADQAMYHSKQNKLLYTLYKDIENYS